MYSYTFKVSFGCRVCCLKVTPAWVLSRFTRIIGIDKRACTGLHHVQDSWRSSATEQNFCDWIHMKRHNSVPVTFETFFTDHSYIHLTWLFIMCTCYTHALYTHSCVFRACVTSLSGLRNDHSTPTTSGWAFVLEGEQWIPLRWVRETVQQCWAIQRNNRFYCTRFQGS